MACRRTARLLALGGAALLFTTLAAGATEGEAPLVLPPLPAAPPLAAELTTGSIRAHHPRRPALVAPSETDRLALNDAVGFYADGDIADGDGMAALIGAEGVKAAAEWAAIRHNRERLGFRRLQSFLGRHPDFAMRDWIRRRAEDALFAERLPAWTVLDFFHGAAPEMASGDAALALVRLAEGNIGEARRLARTAWARDRVGRDVEMALIKTFPDVITPAAIRDRAVALALAGQRAEAQRLAAKAGKASGALVSVVLATVGRSENPRVLDAIPAEFADHPGAIFARLQILRRTGKVPEARDLMIDAPKDPADLGAPDVWWLERRALARALLDRGDAAGAYRVTAEHAAAGNAAQVDAEVHAGWIALRFLKYPDTAAIHFHRAAALARTAHSLGRAHYWLGRAIDAGAPGDARLVYETSAQSSTTFYGQLSAERLGRREIAIAASRAEAEVLDRVAQRVDVQAIRHLIATGEQALARPLIHDLARTLPTGAEVDALATLVARDGDAELLLSIGKAAVQRGLPVHDHAFPTDGIPAHQPIAGSPEIAMTHAIARQESAFNPRAVSHANARGLMQMLPSTAARTAKRFKLPFHPAKLTEDAAFSAMLGSAHLGELMEETRGSLIMTFAAYNAGGHRVKQWVAAYGDPRDPAVDPIDWIERIPFQETRHYVQKIMENLTIYRARLAGGRAALTISADLRTGQR